MQRHNHTFSSPVPVDGWFGHFAPRFIIFSTVVGFLTRTVLLFIPPSVISFTFAQWAAVYGLGLLNDIAFATLALAPAFVVNSLLSDSKYSRALGPAVLVGLIALTAYSFIPGNIFSEYGKALKTAMQVISSLLLISFSLRFLIPGIRKGWCGAGLHFLMGLYVFLIILNSLSECFFWYEFGVRYNFIAVDYLIYTNEVIGNIMESYPIVPMFAAVLLVSVTVSWKMFRGKDFSNCSTGALSFLKSLLVYAPAFALSFFWLHWCYRDLQLENNYANELRCNGCWNFLEAYNSSSLDYSRFYGMLPEDEAKALKQELCGQEKDGFRNMPGSATPAKKNIVVVAVESLSADFFTDYGNPDSLTPNLDTLMRKSLVFDNLFAAGNRSVRGLEALTLCIPPSAGESVIKRPDNGGKFSTASVLREMGYTCTFYYGGESYFDNMKTYFSGNGFDIVDKSLYRPEDITFSNIWGTCDEDTYKVALRDMDSKALGGQPFHSLIFTISNHRPYTFPTGKGDFDADIKTRKGAVKYTDFAIGNFLKEASTRAWFSNTVFVIIADHCASSAGKTSIPVDKYHIPAIIYSPGFIEPQRISKLCSQIDIMPTVFSLLGFSYRSQFYGQDILAGDFFERAFMATYQDLGYLRDDILTVLSPVRRVQQFDVREDDPWTRTESLRESTDPELARQAMVFYQNINLEY